jgi:hypothetical protein
MGALSVQEGWAAAGDMDVVLAGLAVSMQGIDFSS